MVKSYWRGRVAETVLTCLLYNIFSMAAHLVFMLYYCLELMITDLYFVIFSQRNPGNPHFSHMKSQTHKKRFNSQTWNQQCLAPDYPDCGEDKNLYSTGFTHSEL